MSASLPRIKTVQEIHNPPQPKFRKLTLNSDNQEERKTSLKALKTERLKSLSRYSTVQEQKEYKNQKIHLNLIERKLLNGTYDQKKQTSHELNSLKQKRDHFKVQTALKIRQIDRLKRLLQEVKEEIAEMVAGKDVAEKKVSQAKEKYQSQVAQTESARQNQTVLEHMHKTRQDININLCKRKNELQGYLDHLASLRALMDKQLRELNDRVKIREVNLQDRIQKALKDRNQRNQIMSKHQQKILKRKEDQILHSQRSKQYVAELDQLQIANELREFNSVYQKILANLFMSNLCSSTLINLHQKYESYEYAYRKLYSYRSFDPDQPQTLVDRFIEHAAEKVERELTIKQKESLIEELRRKKEALKEKLMLAQQELLQNEEKMTKSQIALEESQHQQIIASLEEGRKDNEEAADRVRQHLVRLLAMLKKKGDRRSSSKNQAAGKNMQALSEIIIQLTKEN